jgi:hypothetical protein
MTGGGEGVVMLGSKVRDKAAVTRPDGEAATVPFTLYTTAAERMPCGGKQSTPLLEISASAVRKSNEKGEDCEAVMDLLL